MSVILGVIGVYVPLIFAITLGGGRNITQTTNSNVGIKGRCILFISILGLRIVFYALSLNKLLILLNSSSNTDAFINNETPKDKETKYNKNINIKVWCFFILWIMLQIKTNHL